MEKTRNPDKYNRNLERNKMRGIMLERRHIWEEAVKQAERLAARHDPSGKTFNVSPVTTLEDGTVTTLERLERKKQRQQEIEAKEAAKKAAEENGQDVEMQDVDDKSGVVTNGEVKVDQLPQNDLVNGKPRKPGISKTQQKKLAKFEPRPPPPRPILPEGVSVPEGEENFIELWDLPDGEVERRVNRAKRRKADARKELRRKQQAGKAERRLARDAKRKTYRDIKLVWKMINQERVKERTRMKSLEEEEAKKIAVEIANVERARAMQACQSLGCAVENTIGIDEIEPRLPGLKGQEIDWSILDKEDEDPNAFSIKQASAATTKSSKRVDLSTAAKETQSISLVPSSTRNAPDPSSTSDFLSFNQDPSNTNDHTPLTYNHRLRRKLRRALDDAQIRKEALVRQAAIAKCKSLEIPPPPILLTPLKPLNKLQPRILENGMLETEKQGRVRTRMELADFNAASKVLRRQAKQKALEAGLRRYAEATGRIPAQDGGVEGEGEEKATVRKEDEEATKGTGIGDQERHFWEEQFRTNFGAKSHLLET